MKVIVLIALRCFSNPLLNHCYEDIITSRVSRQLTRGLNCSQPYSGITVYLFRVSVVY